MQPPAAAASTAKALAACCVPGHAGSGPHSKRAGSTFHNVCKWGQLDFRMRGKILQLSTPSIENLRNCLQLFGGVLIRPRHKQQRGDPAAKTLPPDLLPQGRQKRQQGVPLVNVASR